MRKLIAALALSIPLIMTGCQNDPDSVSAAPSASSKPVVGAAPAKMTAWQVDRDTNPVTGEKRVVAYLSGREGENIYLRKFGKKVDCYITTREFLETTENMESRESTVQFRFDSGKLIRQSWVISDNNEALFAPGNCQTFLAQLRDAKSLAFEFRPTDKIPEQLVFDVVGLPSEFAELVVGVKSSAAGARDVKPMMLNGSRKPAAEKLVVGDKLLPLCSEVRKPGSVDFPTCREDVPSSTAPLCKDLPADKIEYPNCRVN